jgi:hypothetical protein
MNALVVIALSLIIVILYRHEQKEWRSFLEQYYKDFPDKRP